MLTSRLRMGQHARLAMAVSFARRRARWILPAFPRWGMPWSSMPARRKASTLVLAWAVLWSSACMDPPPAAAPPRLIVRGQELDLSVGETVLLAETPATRFRLEGVVSDHRCARGAQCAVAGAVSVALDLLAVDGAKRTVQLATLDRAGAGPGLQDSPTACVMFGTGALHLRAVEPLPSLDGPVKRDLYRVRVEVTDTCSVIH